MVEEKILKLFINDITKNSTSLKKLIFTQQTFSWEVITSHIFLNLLKSFGSNNVNIPIIKVHDKFFYPTSLENNVLEYFEATLQKELNKRIKLKRNKCFQYEASKKKSIFRKLVVNNLNFSARYKTNKKNFILSMKKAKLLTNHPIVKS